MTRLLKVKRLSCLFLSLSIVMLLCPVLQVNAQFFSSQPSSSTENIQDLSEVVNEDTLMTPTMATAWQEYQIALETLTFQNIQTTEWNGDSVEEVTEKFAASVTPVEHTLPGSEDFNFLLYTYQGFNEESSLDTIEIGFIFIDNHLIFSAISNLVMDFSNENFISKTNADQIKLDNTSLSDIAAINPRIKAVAHMLVNDQSKDVIVMDSGSDFADGMTHFYFIEEGVVTHHEELDIFSAMQGTHTIIFDFMAFYYADGIVGEHKDDNSVSQHSSDSHGLDYLDSLNRLMTDRQNNNGAISQAWEGYLKAIDQLEFRDLASEDLMGSLIGEVESSFDVGSAPKRIDAPNGIMSLLVYEYSEKESGPFGSSNTTELTLYFVDDLLAFVGIFNQSSYVDDERLLTEETISEMSNGTTTVSDLVNENPVVLGMGYMVQSEEPRVVTTVLSGATISEAMVEFLFIREGVIRGIDTMPFVEATNDLSLNMFYNLGDFFNAENNGIETIIEE